MSVTDAATAQGMATRHRRSVKAVIANLDKVNALWKKMMDNNQIKWGGYGTYCEWYVRKLKETSSWATGQLGSRSFEEKDPMAKAELPYCFIDQTYGVSEKSIKTNRAAGSEKIFDIQKENAYNAMNAMYRALAACIYSDGTDALVPVGLRGITGDAYESSNAIAVAANKSYAGIALTGSSAISSWADGGTGSKQTGFSYDYWYPIVQSVAEIPINIGTGNKWSSEGMYYLQWMENRMTYSADISGTGDISKPDMALMAQDPWNDLVNTLAKSQITYNVMLGDKSATLGNFPNVQVGGLTCYRDDNVPADSGSLERVFVLDSKAFYIDTLQKKSEGLIEGDWKQDDPEVVGGVGVYKSNLALVCKTPKAVGVIVGCND